MRVLGYLALGALTVGVGLACASQPRAQFDGTDGGKAQAESPVPPGFQTDGGVDAAPACVTCSPDLHSVLDCDDGKVIETCPDDQGCSPGGHCVPACDAARNNQSTLGCDYYAVTPVSIDPYWSCFAVFVANTWSTEVTLGVEHDGITLPVANFAYVPQGTGSTLTYTPLTGALPQGGIAILFLAEDGDACPRDAVMKNVALNGTGITKAFHITASAPIVGYDIYPFGGGSSAVASATLLLPTSAWGDNYIATMPYEHMITPSWIAVVASEDGTEVTLSPTADVVGGVAVAPTPKGVPKTYALARGEVLKLQQLTDLSGTPLLANKPIGVWGGTACAFYPQGVGACDGMHQQLPPIKALGHAYAAVRHRDRYPGKPEKAGWRFVGAVDGTTLTYDPPQPGAPTTLASGQVVIYDADDPFVVESQDDKHPFYLGQYMTGCGVYGGEPDCRGDPEWVNVVPPEQFRASYTFFTDPTYPTTHLVFVRAKAPDGTFKDVDLDCAGTLSGWKSFGSGELEYTRFDVIKDDFVPQGSCNNGRHEANSDGPFGVTVWGWGQAGTVRPTTACSYAYPAGMSVRPINTVTVPPAPK